MTITVLGSDFLTSSTVLWNGASLPTTWVSATQLSAKIPLNDFLSMGTANITVSNAETGGGTSSPQTFKILAAPLATNRIRLLNLLPQDVVWNATHGKLLASLSSTDSTNPNTIVSIDPVSLTVGTPVAAGNNPHNLSISSDAAYLWVGLDGDGAVQRFLLPSLTKDISFPVPSGVVGMQQRAITLQAAPVNPHTIGLVAGNMDYTSGNGVYVFDDAVQRPVSLSPVPGEFIDWIQWGKDDSTLYGTQYESIDPPGLSVLNVTPAGVSLQGVYGANAITSAGITQYDKGSGLLYSIDGQAIDGPNRTQAGFFNVGDMQGAVCTPDSSLNRYFCVGNVYTGTDVPQWELRVFNQKTYGVIERVSLEPVITGSAKKLVRWGNAGLVIVTIPGPAQVGATNPGGLFLIDGSAVNPNATPDVTTGTNLPAYEAMTSLSPQAAPAGSGDTVVTITGNNFTPDSQACWNCNYLQIQSLPTTYINATQLSVTIPASLLTKTQSLNLSVYDAAEPSFESFSGNSLTFTVSPPANTGINLTAVNLAALSLAWDSTDSLLYVGTSDSDPVYPNAIVAVNPTTGSVTQSQAVDSEPFLLSMSAGNQFLYVGFAGATNVTQLQLPGLNAPVTWPLFTSNSLLYGVGPYFAGDLKAAPVNPHTTAVTMFIQPTQLDYTETAIGGVAIYDDAAQRPAIAPGWGVSGGNIFDTLTWGSSDSTLYAAAFGDSSQLDLLSVNSSGTSFQSDLTSTDGTSGDIHFDSATGFIYYDDGQVINPASNTIVGNLNASGLVVPDPTLNRIFILGQTVAQSQTNNYTIESFDQGTYAAISSITVDNILGLPTALVRWGASGLALVTVNETPGAYGGPGYGGPGGMLYILQDSTLVSNAKPADRNTAAEMEKVQLRWKRLSKPALAQMLRSHTSARFN